MISLISRPLVLIESPYAATTTDGLSKNIEYARRCVRHSLMHGEAPLASHLFYTQPGILDDTDPNERTLGILCGFAWGSHASLVAFYTDRGWSPGMHTAFTRLDGRPHVFRSLFGDKPTQPPPHLPGPGDN